MSELANSVTAPIEPIVGPIAPPVTQPVTEVTPQAPAPMIYTGTSNNLMPGAALLFAGVLAFPMGMTDVFFAEATAWTFAIWGLLLIYVGLLEINETYEVTDDALIVRNVMRPWAPRKTFDWPRVTRLDVVVKRAEARDNDVEMQVYYQPEGELANERRDRVYNASLAAAIVERAYLNPADRNTPNDVTRIPRGEKTTYTWK
jgi:hypothetical protein